MSGVVGTGNSGKGKLQAGDVALDFTLPSVDGKLVSLVSVIREGRIVLLVFLRHLG